MAKHLVIVESPAKARTLTKYLGRDYQVKASVGHVVDLPKSKLGVDIEHDFEPEYTVIHGKSKIITELRQAAKGKETVFLAPDPDREGEAIAWHIANRLDGKKTKVRRVLFNEITKKAVQEALKHPKDLDQNLFEAQQTRRILDRLVGYQISPLLWNKVRRGLSAGRVQSVAVRVVCEREREIQAFQKVEYWSITAQLEAGAPPVFPPRLIRIGDQQARSGEVPGRERGGGQGSGRPACARRRGRSPRSSARSAAASRRRRSSPRACSRRRRASSATPPTGRCASPSGSTRASSSAPRGRWA